MLESETKDIKKVGTRKKKKEFRENWDLLGLLFTSFKFLETVSIPVYSSGENVK